ncbi:MULTISPECIES: EAL domain-containing protein [Niallia]|uniref:EAL domain-containing protein n=1 Tax=Niallia TaxID=2837506 RepID=UPI001F2B099B|nr:MULTISPECIES: EAL domain-containing protein [Niallia]MCF2649904.1 EAL domain-containing protein [Niallia circulans]MCM3361117.1 EAL domain-containing protein [Niallia sp. MER TA 168]
MDELTVLKDKNYYHVYQPIWNIKKWEIIGYESLFRIANDQEMSIETFFEEAREENHLFELDTFLINNTIENFQSLSPRRKRPLFVNIFPSTILNKGFNMFVSTLIRNFPTMKGKIVFEINETILERALWDMPLFKEGLSILKANQFQIAIDDFGKGVANFQCIMEITPDIIKIDRYFSNNLAFSPEKQKFINHLLNIADEKTKIILEGIEEETDLAMTKVLRVPFAQGFLLGKPEILV